MWLYSYNYNEYIETAGSTDHINSSWYLCTAFSEVCFGKILSYIKISFFFFVCQQVHSCLKRSKQLTKPPLANLSLVSVHLILHTPWCATTAGIEMVFGRSQCHVFHIRSLELLPQVSKTKFLTASFFKNMFAIQPAKNINNTHTMSDSCYQLFSYFNNFINILM